MDILTTQKQLILSVPLGSTRPDIKRTDHYLKMSFCVGPI